MYVVSASFTPVRQLFLPHLLTSGPNATAPQPVNGDSKSLLLCALLFTMLESHRIHGAGIYNIYHQYTPNVSIYTIHGSYGNSRWYIYPLVNIQKAIENGPFVVDLPHLKMAVFQFANCKRLPARVIHVIEKRVFFTKFKVVFTSRSKTSHQSSPVAAERRPMTNLATWSRDFMGIFQLQLWGFPCRWRSPGCWMVYMENPNRKLQKWMITRGTPHWWKPPYL